MSYFYSKAAAGGSFPAADLLWTEADDNGGTTVTSTTGPNLTIAAGVGWSTTGGGVSIDFPGSETAIATANSNIAYGTISTLSFWAYADTESVFIHSNTAHNASYSWNIWSDGGTATVTLVGGAYGTRLHGTYTPGSTGAWHHYVYVINMAVNNGTGFGSVKVYVDGSEVTFTKTVDAKEDGTGASTAALTFGTWVSALMDDIRIWSTALTAGEISALYAAGRQ
jgi:hypothetical protein